MSFLAWSIRNHVYCSSQYEVSRCNPHSVTEKSFSVIKFKPKSSDLRRCHLYVQCWDDILSLNQTSEMSSLAWTIKILWAVNLNTSPSDTIFSHFSVKVSAKILRVLLVEALSWDGVQHIESSARWVFSTLSLPTLPPTAGKHKQIYNYFISVIHAIVFKNIQCTVQVHPIKYNILYDKVEGHIEILVIHIYSRFFLFWKKFKWI